jgi:biotin carboxyl carrier protein
MRYQIAIGDRKYDVEIGTIKEGVALVTVNAMTYEVAIENYAEVVAGRAEVGQPEVRPLPTRARAATDAAPPPKSPVTAPAAAAGLGVIVAPIPGLIIDVMVKVGDRVGAGHVVLTMEAMKMVNNITAMVAGTVREVRVQKGAEVTTGDVLVVIG